MPKKLAPRPMYRDGLPSDATIELPTEKIDPDDMIQVGVMKEAVVQNSDAETFAEQPIAAANVAELPATALPTVSLVTSPQAQGKAVGGCMYIGPSLPGGILQRGSCFVQGVGEVAAYAQAQLAKHPRARSFLVPKEGVAAAIKSLSDSASALANDFDGLSAELRKE